jgi:hypothetical protein
MFSSISLAAASRLSLKIPPSPSLLIYLLLQDMVEPLGLDLIVIPLWVFLSLLCY